MMEVSSEKKFRRKTVWMNRYLCMNEIIFNFGSVELSVWTVTVQYFQTDQSTTDLPETPQRPNLDNTAKI